MYLAQVKRKQRKQSHKKNKYGNFIPKAHCLDNECVICLDDLQCNPDVEKKKQSGIVFETKCNHKFHTICLSEWLEITKKTVKTCPICRTLIHEHDCVTIWAIQNECIDERTKSKYCQKKYTG